MLAKAGTRIKCPKCGAIIGRFNIDCADITKIEKATFESRSGAVPVEVDSFKDDATRHGCKSCDFDGLILAGDNWIVRGDLIGP